MESKSFVKVLRKVIREEVRSAVKELLAEQQVNHNAVINHGMNLHELADKRPVRKKKRFTKNDMLNDILNETSGIPSDGPIVSQDYPSIGNFKSDMAESFGMSRQPQQLATNDINGKPINMSNEKVATAVNAMTKDYSAVMAKMRETDKQKGKKVV